jgi:carbamoyl-phosphate synthase large subunit
MQKALRSLETGLDGFSERVLVDAPDRDQRLQQELRAAGPERILYVGDAFRAGYSIEAVHELTRIDPWFLAQIRELIGLEQTLRASNIPVLDRDRMVALKRKGFSDARLARLMGISEAAVRARRYELGVRPVYKRVDSCAAEFATSTAYMYSTYEEECESNPTRREKIMVLGGGPNRIGQGIEFDYCCVHAALAMRESGYETIMVNCNPETVSTDFDTSDRLNFEPLTLEDVLE